MTAVQIHLLLNHVSVLGLIVGLLVLGWGLLTRSREIRRLSLGMLFLTALLTVPVFLSGEKAEHLVESYPRDEAAIEAHEEIAKPTLAAILATGLLALLLLMLETRNPEKSSPLPLVMLLVLSGTIGTGLVSSTAHQGGLISHPELRSGSPSAILEPPALDGEAEEGRDD